MLSFRTYRTLFCILFISQTALTWADNPATVNPSIKQPQLITPVVFSKLSIEELQKSAPRSPLSDRITFFSAQFLGQRYVGGPLGEGPQGEFDQGPLYRFDAFDCLTYVETVLALALSSSPQTFEQCINQIRYDQGDVFFTTRNHFMSLDWNPHNQQRGFIKDITLSIQDDHHQPVAQYARAFIDKPSWYQHLPESIIRLDPPQPTEQAIKLKKLKRAGEQFKGATMLVPYIPLTILFNENQQANQAIFKQIPHAAIIEVVRPNWDLTQEIGTHLNVSHLGFAIWKDGQLWFREASSIEKKVVDIPLENYLRQTLNSPTIRGINIQMALTPKRPCGG